MKKVFVITLISAGIVLASCSDIRRESGSAYMPDMAYSRAYETYSERDSTIFTEDAAHTDDKIFYNNMPVAGTMARGEEIPFPYAKDASGDTTNYVASKQYPNPLPVLDSAHMKEAERLYLINCGICHGPKLDGNGPLYKDGNGPYPAKPATLVGDAKYENMPDGQMYYSVTYGKNLMGSYASQLNRDQRWMIIHYIKAKQAKAKPTVTPAAASDSAKVSMAKK
ncbi:MAG TPA: cytochrome c [Panacibacter sp.]|nr:cytochrome c [Panacibacter sp.]HNP44570.1 cytochrome c [Panacibacter sp.]